MNQIDALLNKLCPIGVPIVPLGEIVKNLDSKRRPVSKDNRVLGPFPYYGANGIQDWVDDFIFDGTYLLIGEDGSVLNNDGTPVLNWLEGKAWVNNHAHILEAIDETVNLRFVFHFLSKTKIAEFVTGGSQLKLNQGNLNKIPISLPPIEVQSRIAMILDAYKELEAELEAELKARKKQYEYYRNQLLTFDKQGGVRWVPMGDVAKIRNGADWKALPSGEIPVFGSGGKMGSVGTSVYDGPSVLIPRKGSLGNLFYLNEPFWTVDTCFYTEIDSSSCLPKFLYYFLKTQELAALNLAGGVPSLTQTQLNRILVPIPTIERQAEIVEILDKFDALVSDLSIGLPAELKARRHQYEYYRNQLLTFKKIDAA